MAKTGIVFDISRASFHDGPGIRTVVFLKGCPLRCVWCHNPESQSFMPQLSYNSSKCTLCGNCGCCSEKVHSFVKKEHVVEYSRCNLNCKCISECPTEALTIIGKEMTIEELMHEVLKDKIFYEKSGGGLTISGGEPTAQLDFLIELLQKAKEQGVSTCIETCGYANQRTFEGLLPLVDCFLFDYKLADSVEHYKYTGVPNDQILSNLYFLYAAKAKIILRCPIILGINDNESHLRGIAYLSAKYSDINEIQLMAYNNWGNSKNINIGNTEYFETQIQDLRSKELWLKLLKQYGCSKAKIG